MLHQSTQERTHKNNLLLAGSTAFLAAATNVAGAMACFSFTANVTGHAASFARHLLTNSWFEMTIVLIWLFLFFAGAFLAHFLIRSFEHKGPYRSHTLPLIVEMVLLFGITLVAETGKLTSERGSLVLAGILLFAMGLQNSTVSFISGGGIKTSHLTGLFTDLGSDVSEWMHPKTSRTPALKKRLQLRLIILLFYLAGGVAGGLLYIQTGMITFSLLGCILLFIVVYDWIPGGKENQEET